MSSFINAPIYHWTYKLWIKLLVAMLMLRIKMCRSVSTIGGNMGTAGAPSAGNAHAT
jgi:hypothetical protein